MTAPDVLYYYDFVSPNSYIAREELLEKRSEWNIEIRWKPVFFAGILKELDVHFDNSHPKTRYAKRDMKRWCEHYGIPFSMPENHPINSLRAMRGSLAVRRMAPEKLEDYQSAIFEAYYVENRDISRPGTLADRVDALGLDSTQFARILQADDVKQTLKSRTEEALQRGVFGLPTLVVDGEKFWGKDRMLFVEKALND